jgi:radical SAM protein with 4Fe4S-binding SPASM domain
MIDSTNFCAAPFKEILIDTDGKILPCCEYKYQPSSYVSFNLAQFDELQKTQMHTLRQNMLDNVHDTGCTYCKNKERIPGQLNLRKYINVKYPAIPNVNEHDIQGIEIRFGNYCNLKCIMCGPYASSSLDEEYTKNKTIYLANNFSTNNAKTMRWWEEPRALEQLKQIVKNIKYIHFGGGEPMMIPELIDILDVIDSDKIVRISFNTNMTRVTDKLLNSLDRFKPGTVNISASLEGVGAQNDYIRYGSKWDTIDNAIGQVLALPKLRLFIATVLQATSVYAIPGLLEYAKNKKLPIQFSEVYSESGYGTGGYLTVNSVSPKDIMLLQEYLDTWPNAVLQSWVNAYKFDPEKHTQFRKYTEMIDGIRGTDFKTTFNPNWD